MAIRANQITLRDFGENDRKTLSAILPDIEKFFCAGAMIKFHYDRRIGGPTIHARILFFFSNQFFGPLRSIFSASRSLAPTPINGLTFLKSLLNSTPLWPSA